MLREWKLLDLERYVENLLNPAFEKSRHYDWKVEWCDGDQVMSITNPEHRVEVISWVRDPDDRYTTKSMAVRLFTKGTHQDRLVTSVFLQPYRSLLGGTLWAWSGVVEHDVKTWWQILDPLLHEIEAGRIPIGQKAMEDLIHFP